MMAPGFFLTFKNVLLGKHEKENDDNDRRSGIADVAIG